MAPVSPQPASAPVPGDGSPAREGSDWGLQASWYWRGQSCHWRRLGSEQDPALVLLHGFGAGSGHWRRNVEALSQAGWCVYSLDLLGFGASSQAPLRLDNRLWARQLDAFLRDVVMTPAVVVGHSLGGLVALTGAVFVPDLVRAVIAAPLPDPTLLLADPQAPLAAPRRRPWRRQLHRTLVTLLCRLLPLELLVPLLAHSPLLDLGIQAAYRNPVIGDDELHRLIARPARRGGAVRALRAMSIAMALRPHAATAASLLRRIRQPLLLVWGRDDRLVPLDVAQQCRKFHHGHSLEVIEGAGHCPHDETPEAFHRAVLPWLAQLRSLDDRSHGLP